MTCSSPPSRRLLWQVEITLTQLFLNLYLSSFIKTRPSDIYLYVRQSTLNVELDHPVLRTRLANRWGMVYLTAPTPLRISEFFFSVYITNICQTIWVIWKNGLNWTNLRVNMSISALGRLKNDNLSKLLPGRGSISLSLSSSRSLLSSNAKKNLTRSSLYSRPTFFSQSLDGLVQVVVQKILERFCFSIEPGSIFVVVVVGWSFKTAEN